MIQRHHCSAASLEDHVTITTTDEDNIYESSDDESSSSDYGNDLSGVVNMTYVNLREDTSPRCDACLIHSMIIAVNSIQQQKMGIVQSLNPLLHLPKVHILR